MLKIIFCVVKKNRIGQHSLRSANNPVGQYIDIRSNPEPQHALNTSEFLFGKMSELLFNGIWFRKRYNNFKDLFQTELESVWKSCQKIHTKNAEPNWNRFGNGHWIKCSCIALDPNFWPGEEEEEENIVLGLHLHLIVSDCIAQIFD